MSDGVTRGRKGLPMTLETTSRTRTTATRAAVGLGLVAADVVAVVIGTQNSRPGASLRSSHPTATADRFKVGPPLATYVDPDRLVLFIHGISEPGTWGGATSVGDLTLAFANDLDNVGVFLRGARVGTLRHVVDGVVEASQSGRTLAWTEHTGGSAHVVVAAVRGATVRELGRLAVDPGVLDNDSEGSERVMAVNDDHTVTYGGITSGHSWTPGGAPRDADVSRYLTRPTGFPNSVDPPDLNPAGTWGVWPTNDEGRSPADIDGVWTTVTVQQPRRPDTRFTFTMPPGDNVQWAFWESDTDVVVAVSSRLPVAGSADEAEGYVRCNVRTHGCEYAPTPGGA
jgi:hypothetical protein